MTSDLPWTSYQLDHLCGSAQVERDGDEVQMPGETGRGVSGRRGEALTLPTVDYDFQGGGHEVLEAGHENTEEGAKRGGTLRLVVGAHAAV